MISQHLAQTAEAITQTLAMRQTEPPDRTMPETWEFMRHGEVDHLRQTAEAILATYQTQAAAVGNAARIIRECRDNLGTVYACGNGGSAATASHFVNDLVKAAGCRAICLTDNVPLLTAYGNDESYQYALSSILNRLSQKKDVLFCISVSGDSPNIVEVADTGFYSGLQVIGLGSKRRGRLFEKTKVFIEAQSDSMEVSEDCHLAICHAIVRVLAQ